MVKLSDYGLHSLYEQIDENEGENHLLKKKIWRAPEQLKSSNKRGSKKGDVYSLSLLFYEVLTGKLPFFDSEKNDYLMPLSKCYMIVNIS